MSVIEPADLELSLRRKSNTRYSVDLVYSQPGSEVDTKPLVGRTVTARFDEAALRAAATDPILYGRLLGQMLFADEHLARAVAEARAVAAGQGRPLRVRLSLPTDTPELHSLAWETLRDPRDDVAFALSEQVIFTRNLGSADWRPVTLRAKSDLRALVVIAAPEALTSYRLAPIDVGAEQARALAGLADFPTTVLAASGQAHLPTITATLRDGYDILYLVAHGVLDDGEPWLLLDDGQGGVAHVPGADFAARIADLPYPPRLVLLSSCDSAGTAGREALAAVGPRLAAAGIPAVIAMQSRISLVTNAHFASTFFHELRRDGLIDRALAAARQAVAAMPDWWVMVLFTRLRSGRIWYEPGFETDDFKKWPALLRSISNRKCTPILGPGLLEAVAGSTRDLARQLAEEFNFPLAPFARDDLPQVAQYLAVNQSVDFMRDEVERSLRQILGKRTPGDTIGDEDPLAGLLAAAGRKRRSDDVAEPHRVLAHLPIPIYLTANPDQLLADALHDAGRPPQVLICPWYVEEQHYKAPEARPPSEAAPLIFHLLGHLEEPDSLVITEDDYFRYLIGVRRNVELIPDAVQRALADTALLFLGFRFEDWSFRALLQSMLRLSGGSRRGHYTHVAVQIDPQEGATLNPQAARNYLKEYLGPVAAQTYQANISVYWGSVDDFIGELGERWQAARQREQSGAGAGKATP